MTNPTRWWLPKAVIRRLWPNLAPYCLRNRSTNLTSSQKAQVTAQLAIVASMTPQTRIILALSQVDGLSVEEIAVQLKISRRSVRRHLRRAITIIARHRERL